MMEAHTSFSSKREQSESDEHATGGENNWSSGEKQYDRKTIPQKSFQYFLLSLIEKDLYKWFMCRRK